MKPSNSETGRKLKILAIHGYRQNADIFRKKTGSLRKIASKWAEFSYITAPHKVDISSNSESIHNGQGEEVGQYSWFFNREDKSFKGNRIGGPAIGFDDSIQVLEEAFENQGPFDGVLGFSQGACVVSLLCYLKENKLLKFDFDFVISVAGFKSGSIPHAEYYKKIFKIPSLHVYGENDQIILPQMSRELSESFEYSQILVHPGGHFVPASSSQKQTYQDFFRLQYEVKN